MPPAPLATVGTCFADLLLTSVWIKASRLHPLIPRESERSAKLYRSRGAVEREFGRLKNEWALTPLRVRRIERVRLHADLMILVSRQEWDSRT